MISIFGTRFGFRVSQKCHLHKTLRRSYVTYIQGQSPQPQVREYFYYIDHQGMVFFVLLADVLWKYRIIFWLDYVQLLVFDIIILLYLYVISFTVVSGWCSHKEFYFMLQRYKTTFKKLEKHYYPCYLCCSR